MLDRMAPEILEQIFQYACTDGGHTGNALAAVSRYVQVFPLPCATILSRFAVHVRLWHLSGYSMTLVDPHRYRRPNWGHYRDGREDPMSAQAIRHCPLELL
jgi:hypothetical protein